ncbi:MAG TPA: alkaline phosphatase family protein [Terriglobales bacterium]|nr:alkaline phosphatase family protein [Terriglobales bacterium]
MKLSPSVLPLFAVAFLSTAALAQYGNTPIKHVVVIFQENRTPDNLFQGLCTANGGVPGCSASGSGKTYEIVSTYVNSDGQTVPLAPVGLATNFDIDHSHGGPKLNGTISGWNFEFQNQGVKGKPASNAPTGCGGNVFGCVVPANNYSQFMYVYNTQVTNSDGSKGGLLDPYITLATSYGWANRMFQTNQGPSFPAHQFIFGATSAPTAPDDALGVFAAENSVPGYGCASGNSVQLIRPNGNSQPPFGTETAGDVTPECFNRNAMDYLFDQATPKITWTYYSSGQSSLWVAPNSLANICIPQAGVCTGPDWTKGASNGFVDTTPPDVLDDIANCALSQVAWITPAGQYSDHPINSGQGPSWVAAIVNAIGSSTNCDGGSGYWKDTAIFITWDDWGGWYDHVRPVFQTGANQNDYQLGFRVPLVVVSAYAKPSYVSNQQYDFGSIVKAIEGIFGLGTLGFADTRATNDLHDFFNFTQPATTYKTIPAPLTGSFFTKNKEQEVDPPDSD